MFFLASMKGSLVFVTYKLEAGGKMVSRCLMERWCRPNGQVKLTESRLKLIVLSEATYIFVPNLPRKTALFWVS